MKDFDIWNSKKKSIDERSNAPFFHDREIWWCALGTNVGYEQDGTGKNFDRPVVVVKGFNKNVFFAVALTGKKKTGKYYLYLGEVDGRDATAVLSQVRLIDSRRLVRKIGVVDEVLFKTLQKSLIEVLFDNTE